MCILVFAHLQCSFLLQNHAGTCGYEPIYCENKCGMKIQRRLLGNHKTSECAKRLLACRYCAKEFVADTLAAHHVKCGRVPVPCPNRCEAPVLAREDLDQHLKEQCTTLVMSCGFKEAGCRFKVIIVDHSPRFRPSLRSVLNFSSFIELVLPRRDSLF